MTDSQKIHAMVLAFQKLEGEYRAEGRTRAAFDVAKAREELSYQSDSFAKLYDILKAA